MMCPDSTMRGHRNSGSLPQPSTLRSGPMLPFHLVVSDLYPSLQNCNHKSLTYNGLMLRKRYKFSRHLTSNFEFWSFPRLPICSTIRSCDASKPRLPVSHTITKEHKQPIHAKPFGTPITTLSFSVRYAINYMKH